MSCRSVGLFYTHHNIREDEQTLYGFITKNERDMFRDLKSVSGIGPKVALAMLSHLSVEHIVEAVQPNLMEQ